MLLRIGVAVNASSTKCPKIDDFVVIVKELILLALFCGDDTIDDGPPDTRPEDKGKCEDDDDPGTTKSSVQGKSGKPGTPLIGVAAGVCIVVAAVVVVVLLLLLPWITEFVDDDAVAVIGE